MFKTNHILLSKKILVEKSRHSNLKFFNGNGTKVKTCSETVMHQIEMAINVASMFQRTKLRQPTEKRQLLENKQIFRNIQDF